MSTQTPTRTEKAPRRRFRGGDVADPGIYFDRRELAFRSLDEEGPLPGGLDAEWRRVPALFLLLAAPLVSIAYVVFLRAIHVGIPLVYPQVLRGPFSQDSLAEVEEYTRFSPLVPFFRPEVLGEQPVHLTVTRPPRAEVVVFWQAERFLRLAEREGGERPAVPQDARIWTLRGPAAAGENHWWRRGRTIYAVARRGELWIELRTDLSDDDARRIVESLRPYRELL